MRQQFLTGSIRRDRVGHAQDGVRARGPGGGLRHERALSVGTRAESAQVPVKYEIPKEVVTEAIVNAVAHR